MALELKQLSNIQQAITKFDPFKKILRHFYLLKGT